jgi:moderate conductance mechanosensitive channel
MSGFWRRCLAGLLTCLTFTLIVVGQPIASAQLPTTAGLVSRLPLSQLPMPNLSPQSETNLPNGVKRVGNIEIVGVKFDGNELFKIVSTAVPDRAKPGGLMPVEVRAQQIEENLNLLVASDESQDAGSDRPTLYDPKTFNVTIQELEGETVLVARDNQRTQPRVLMTITDRDAEYYGLSKKELAGRLAERIQQTIIPSLAERLPAEANRRGQRLLRWILLVTLLGLTLLATRRWLGVWNKRLRALQAERQQQVAESTAAVGADPQTEQAMEVMAAAHVEPQAWHTELAELPADIVDLLKTQFSLSQRIKLIDFCRWLLLWVQILLWIWMISLGLDVWLVTRPYSKWFFVLLGLLLLWFVMGFLNRLIDLLLDRFANIWETENLLSFEDAQRRTLRISTIVNALRDLKTFAIYLVGTIWLLGALGIDASSVIALGAVIAFAVTLAFQNLIKDILNGFLILLEDQYALGDVVTIGSASGTVEDMNLRITQLRNAEGRLITIPNSLITQVENQTRTWSRVDFKIVVAYATDVQLALDILRDTAAKMYDEPHWHDLILEPPEVLGVEAFSQTGMTLRLWFKTQPHAKTSVSREFHLRVKQAFEQKNIEVGTP